MKLYLIKFNLHDYDQYDAFVVCAGDEKQVVETIKQEYVSGDEINWDAGYKVEEIKTDEAGIILGSYNAG